MSTTAITSMVDTLDCLMVNLDGVWLQNPDGTWTVLPDDPITALQAAFSKIASGMWKIDPGTGIVTGYRGKRIGHPGSTGYIELSTPLPHLPSKTGRQVSAHRVIWQRFNGPIPAGLQVNHIDGVKSHNWLANLEVLSCRENVRHAFRAGLAGVTRKLDPAKVREVRALIAESDGGNYRAIAERAGVTIRQVIGIGQGVTFQRVR